MLLVFVVCDLLAAHLSWGWLTGAGYALGALAAVAYARREALLLVVTTPPVLFLVALVGAELATAKGSTVLATAEGTALALATSAPWLFAGTVACVVAALARGLPQCVRDFKVELSGMGAQARYEQTARSRSAGAGSAMPRAAVTGAAVTGPATGGAAGADPAGTEPRDRDGADSRPA